MTTRLTRTEPRTDPELLALIEKAKAHVMTPEEVEAQRVSWVIGQIGLMEGETRESAEARVREALRLPRASDRLAATAPGPEAVVTFERTLGIYDKAYDMPGPRRAYTYKHQPDNTGAWRLGRAAWKRPKGGDYIDFGLWHLKALQEEGFGVFEIQPATYAARPPGAAEMRELAGVYIASKTKHGPRWRDMRAAGAPIVSTWIDEAEAGATSDWPDLWRRCVSEASAAATTIVYAEAGEILKGGWIEVGAALAHGRRVIAVVADNFSVFHHPDIERVATVDEAFKLAASRALQTAPGSSPGQASPQPTAELP